MKNNRNELKCKTLGFVDVNALCTCSKKLIWAGSSLDKLYTRLLLKLKKEKEAHPAFRGHKRVIAPAMYFSSAAFGNKKAEPARSAFTAGRPRSHVMGKRTCLDSILTPWNSRAIKHMRTQCVPGSFPLPQKSLGTRLGLGPAMLLIRMRTA